MVLQRLYYSTAAWLRGFRRFYSLGYFFHFFSEGLMVGEAGSGRQILTQKLSCEQHAGEI